MNAGPPGSGPRSDTSPSSQPASEEPEPALGSFPWHNMNQVTANTTTTATTGPGTPCNGFPPYLSNGKVPALIAFMPVSKEGRELFVLSGSHTKGVEEVTEKPNEGACSLFVGGRGLWQILLFHPLLFHAGTRGWKSFDPDDDPSPCTGVHGYFGDQSWLNGATLPSGHASLGDNTQVRASTEGSTTGYAFTGMAEDWMEVDTYIMSEGAKIKVSIVSPGGIEGFKVRRSSQYAIWKTINFTN